MLIKEGKAEFEIKDFLLKKEFYNPAMSIVRDLNVLITSIFSNKNSKYLDLLSSIGANSIRIAKEVGIKVYANDISKDAIEKLKLNAQKNNVNIEILNFDAKCLFTNLKEKFDFIDIDPFGSPIYYLPFITKFLKKNSILSLTATDTATLFGLKPLTCLRRYGIFCNKNDFEREVGIRVLITSSFLLLSKYKILAIPIFAFSEKHFVKIYFKIDFGKEKINNFLKNFGSISYCMNCLNKEIGIKEKCVCGKEFNHIYPIFIKSYIDKNILEKIENELENRKYFQNYEKIKKTIETLKNEDLNVPWYFDLHLVAKIYKTKCIAINEICEKLNKKGFYASKCFLNSKAIRTNASIKNIVNEIMGP